MPTPFCHEKETLKTINLLIYGYESAPVEIVLTPDDTALDILTKAGLEECSLFRKAEPQKYFHKEEAVFDQLRHDEALYAVLPSGD
jgi:hypothetical protein